MPSCLPAMRNNAVAPHALAMNVATANLRMVGTKSLDLTECSVDYKPAVLLKCAASLQEDDGALRLQLPALQHATITASHAWQFGSLNVHWESFEHAANLQTLSFRGISPVSLQADCFSGLRALATVEFAACGLAAIPVALTALGDSLTRLALPSNDALQLDSGGVSILLTLRKLRLDLWKPHQRGTYGAMAGEPLNWSACSLHHLVNLRPAFQEAHAHMPAVRVTDDDWD